MGIRRGVREWVLLLCAGAASGVALGADVDLSRPAPTVARRSPLTFEGDAKGQTVDFTTWKSAVPFGDVVGRVDIGMFCAGGKPLPYGEKLHDWFSAALGRKYREQAVRIGVAAPEATKSVFSDKGGAGAAAFQLGATLLEFDYRICADGDDAKGTAYAKIKWELFSSRRQKVVYSTVIESSANSDAKIPGKKFDADFMEAIVHNLFADPKLADVIRSGGTLDQEPSQTFAALQIDAGSTVSGGVSKAAPELQAAVVTVESGVGSGSAFYIGREGYLLTNAHVVSGAKFVRVRLADGRNLVGEVVRSDVPRDVALLRTDPVSFPVLPMREGPGRVGEEVFALGSPFGRDLGSTLTRGVVSARRVIEGVAFIQSDAAINPGSSGGPLVDGEGKVLGIAQLQRSGGQGINLFIPIDEALGSVGVTIAAKGPVAQGR